MKKTVTLLLLAAALAPVAALAHSHKKRALEVVHPWTPAMLEASIVNIPVFMTVKNRGKARDRLLSATTPLAAKVEFVELQAVGSIKLPNVVSTLEVAASGTLELNSSGPRLLLGGVKKQLHAYDSFKLTLVFEKTGRMEIEVMVEEVEGETHKH